MASGGIFLVGLIGTVADQPPAANLPDNFRYIQTDGVEQYVDGGTWVDVPGGGGGGALPTGWTQDGDNPSNVQTNGAADGSTGSLTVGDSSNQYTALYSNGFAAQNGDHSFAWNWFIGATLADTKISWFGATPATQQDATDGPSLVSALQAYGLLDSGSSWADDGAAVTVQAGVPAGPFQTPLVFDSTAVTGGLYGWDGSAYQKIGGPL